MFNMEQEDRERLDLCYQTISHKIDMTKLWPKLLEHKIYNRDDVNVPRWTKNLSAEDTIKDILLTIKTRGPKAFQNLLLSLRQTSHENIADILEEKSIDDICSNDSSFYHDVQKSPEPLKIELRKATKFMDGPEYDCIQRYPMRSEPRGLVLIITNIYYENVSPRISAKYDEVNLKELFEQMGFEVYIKRNLPTKQIKEVVQEFSKKDDLKKVDSCFVIVSSHGAEDENGNTEIQGIDYPNHDEQGNQEKVLCTDILDFFTAKACPHLTEKPKIFIFQLCRGRMRQNTILYSRLRTDSCTLTARMNEDLNLDIMVPNFLRTRNYQDMLVVQSTLPGHYAYRDSINGSWFIQILCQVFMKLAYKTHIQDLFNIVDAELKCKMTAENHCQTSAVKSIGFNKHCYLNPGLFEKK